MTSEIAFHGKSAVQAKYDQLYAPLDADIESCISTLIRFVEEGWPESHREGALRSLRRIVREDRREAVDEARRVTWDEAYNEGYDYGLGETRDD